MNGLQKGIKIAAICLAVFIISSIASGFLFMISLITDFYPTKNKLDNFVEIYEDITKVDIDLSAAKLIIKPGNKFKVEAKNITEKFTSNSINNTLKIKETNQRFFHNKHVAEITLYIPKEFLLDELTIDNGTGKLEIYNILINNFKLDQGAGIVKITNSQFKNINIEGGIGETKILSSILNNLDLEAGIGSINIEASITGNSKIECGIGKIDLELLGNETDYQLNVTKGIGNIVINNQKQTNNTIYGNGNNKLKIDGAIGEISINFIN